MMTLLDDDALRLLFLEARTLRRWQPRAVDEALLRQVYDVAKWGPTSGNTVPMRVVFVKSPDAREKLVAALDAGNVEQTKTAPVTAIVAYDLQFYENMPKLAPARPEMAARLSTAPDAVRERLAFQGGTLQGAYLIIAARALGLDCGPMGGFDREGGRGVLSERSVEVELPSESRLR